MSSLEGYVGLQPQRDEQGFWHQVEIWKSDMDL